MQMVPHFFWPEEHVLGSHVDSKGVKKNAAMVPRADLRDCGAARDFASRSNARSEGDVTMTATAR